jgi:hypothetical protein
MAAASPAQGSTGFQGNLCQGAWQAGQKASAQQQASVHGTLMQHQMNKDNTKTDAGTSERSNSITQKQRIHGMHATQCVCSAAIYTMQQCLLHLQHMRSFALNAMSCTGTHQSCPWGTRIAASSQALRPGWG